jgi:hypothetical protein
MSREEKTTTKINRPEDRPATTLGGLVEAEDRFSTIRNLLVALLLAVVLLGYAIAASSSYQGCVEAASRDKDANPEKDCSEWVPWPQGGFSDAGKREGSK